MDQPIFDFSEHETSSEADGVPKLETEDELREREAREIGERYAQDLERRNASRTMSPSYLSALPKSLIEKLRVTPDEEEAILFNYAATSSIQKTAIASRISVDKVRAVVYNPASQEAISGLRDMMRVSVINKIEETQTVLLDAIQDPKKLDSSSLTQLSDVFSEISETQLQLLRAQREMTGTTSALSDPTAVFTGEELEYMALLRRRLASGEPPPSARPLDHEVSMNGHEVIDVDLSPTVSTSVPDTSEYTVSIDGIHEVTEEVDPE